MTKYYDKIKHTYSFMGDMVKTNDSKYYRDYIDYLEQSKVPKNVMKGKDFWGRRYITLKVGIQDAETGKLHKTAQVFFQRYSNDERMWTGADFEGEFLKVGGGLSREQHQLLNDIVCGKKVVLEEVHRCKSKHYGHIIASMDVWEKEAIDCIQRNWIIAHSNPKYTLKKQLLNRKLDECLQQVES